MVVNHPHFHPFMRLAYQYVGYLFADGVGRKYIVLKIDKFFRGKQIGFEPRKFVGSFAKHFYLVAGEKMRLTKGVHQMYDLTARFAQVEHAGVVGVKRIVDVLPPSAIARYHHHIFQASPKEEIQQDTHHRQ